MDRLSISIQHGKEVTIAILHEAQPHYKTTSCQLPIAAHKNGRTPLMESYQSDHLHPGKRTPGYFHLVWKLLPLKPRCSYGSIALRIAANTFAGVGR
jgi:hypothetical protein